MIFCNDGTTVMHAGHLITTSKGETYSLLGTILTGPGGFQSMNVGSIQEAVGIVCGMHGGRRL